MKYPVRPGNTKGLAGYPHKVLHSFICLLRIQQLYTGCSNKHDILETSDGWSINRSDMSDEIDGFVKYFENVCFEY